MCTVIDHRDITACKEQKSTTRGEVEWRDCSLHTVTSSVVYYSTHGKNGFDAICVCLLIDHGQHSMEMHTEVTLLYKQVY